MNKKREKMNSNPVGVAPLGDPQERNIINKPNVNGITLIALIITIIVMLILVGVTVNVAINGGLFSKTREATKQTQKEIDREQLQVAVFDSYNNQGILDLDKLKDNLPEGFLEKEGTYESEKGNLFIIENGMVRDVKWTQDENGNILYEEKESDIKIGDYVNYEELVKETTVNTDKLYNDLQEYSGYEGNSYNTEEQISQEDLKWRVLDVKNGNLRLISEKPTKSKVYLLKYNGYNNAVYLLDEVCSTLYSSSKGTAQNLKIEDIEDKINKDQFDYTQYTNSNEDTGKYGGTKEYIDNRYYPEIFTKEKTGWVDDKQGTEYDLSEQKEPIKQIVVKKAENKIKITKTYWNRITQESDWKNKTYQNIFIKDINNTTTNYDQYWLSSRCVYEDLSSASFVVRRVSSGYVDGLNVYNSDGRSYPAAFGVRPVVSLSYDIQIDKEKDNGIWKIK